MSEYERTCAAFSANLQAARLQRGFTQSQLAERSGSSRVTIAQYEGGTSVPSIKQMAKIAAALGISIYELLNPVAEPV